jgi:hypothetical protein
MTSCRSGDCDGVRAGAGLSTQKVHQQNCSSLIDECKIPSSRRAPLKVVATILLMLCFERYNSSHCGSMTPGGLVERAMRDRQRNHVKPLHLAECVSAYEQAVNERALR